MLDLFSCATTFQQKRVIDCLPSQSVPKNTSDIIPSPWINYSSLLTSQSQRMLTISLCCRFGCQVGGHCSRHCWWIPGKLGAKITKHEIVCMLHCLLQVVEWRRLCLMNRELKQTRRWRKREGHLKMQLRVSAIIFQLFKVLMLEKCVLTILESNRNQCLRYKKTKLNICHHMRSSSTHL